MTSRPLTPIDQLADRFVADYCALDPLTATYLGVPGQDDALPDLSPDGYTARAELDSRLLRDLEGMDPRDDVDVVTAAAIRERHGLQRELFEAGEWRRSLNVIESPVQQLRDIFSLMPTDTTQSWASIAARMRGLPAALRQYRATLESGRSAGQVPPDRQIEEVIKQCDALADKDTSFFTALVADPALPQGDFPSALRSELAAAAADARQAFADFATYLGAELGMDAPQSEAVGRARYELFSREFLGATVDLDETYVWGLAELARITAEQEEVAAQLYGPGTTPAQAMARLDRDPRYQLHGTAALKEWMQSTADDAIARLNGVHFDIPAPVQHLECMIAPTQTGGIYYTGPTDDFSRPGRMWWSVPAGVTEFGTWRERTTVYHEGVPGHHLQIAQTVYLRDQLNQWRRNFALVSGHGEGWALYAERLMDQLGFLPDPGDRMGMLDGQRLRAARVVLDIGFHLGKPFPGVDGRSPDGATWDRTRAWAFLKHNANMDDAFLSFELNRYLGWAGQAPSYKIGQRLWEQIRDDERARQGEAFDLKQFHHRALDLGSLGLDTLADAISGRLTLDAWQAAHA